MRITTPEHPADTRGTNGTGTAPEAAAYAALMPSISPNANKYSRGSLLVIGGSTRYTGAPILTALAAARAGAGYVTLVVPQSVVPIAQAQLLTIPVIGLAENTGTFVPGAVTSFLASDPRFDAVVLGPGMGLTAGAADALEHALLQAHKPLLLDADALTLLARSSAAQAACAQRAKAEHALILTPHAGELERLAVAVLAPQPARGNVQQHSAAAAQGATASVVATQPSEGDVAAARGTDPGFLSTVSALATALGATLVAKGPSTHIQHEGRRDTLGFGTAALATAGTGDVLAGVIGALLSQGLAPFEAARLGVYLHSQAGLLAQERLGMRSVIATDVLDCLAAAIVALENLKSPE
ncbi:MAG: NAD(P)H-hydrate dehydratase [Coriobacteriales bacterium]|jgi:NAD(P)H-hydrate epimerase|nr:NAD(P)H-hydrate dehydratase [Coriobacteriales bacterium]